MRAQVFYETGALLGLNQGALDALLDKGATASVSLLGSEYAVKIVEGDTTQKIVTEDTELIKKWVREFSRLTGREAR